MAIFKTQSLKYTIAKIYRDLRLEDPNYEYDIVEWAGEALDFIGAGSQLELKVAEIPVSQFRAIMPTGLVLINQVMFKKEEQDKYQIISYNGKSFPDAFHDSKSNNFFVKTEESYFVNPDYLMFSEQEGFTKISYKAIPTDEQGYPLVPDNQYFREAIFWYCFKHILMLGYQSPAGINYQFAESKWLFYCTAARNKANYPSLSQYEQFKNSWASLLPNVNSYKEGFDRSAHNVMDIEVVRADNLITRPLTTDGREEDA